MIQRIQSIFLFLASGAFFSLFGLPFATSDTAVANLLADRVYNIFDHPILIALTAIGGGVAFLNIFLFKNRGLQIRLGFLAIIAAILLGVMATILILQEPSSAAELDPANGLGIYAVPTALILTVLANFFIKKDEKLVRSADRLR